jgi:hypothetical protein
LGRREEIRVLILWSDVEVYGLGGQKVGFSGEVSFSERVRKGWCTRSNVNSVAGGTKKTVRVSALEEWRGDGVVTGFNRWQRAVVETDGGSWGTFRSKDIRVEAGLELNFG